MAGVGREGTIAQLAEATWICLLGESHWRGEIRQRRRSWTTWPGRRL